MSYKLIPLSMIICDSVIEDSLTKKKSLIGIFNNIHASNVPCIHPSLCVFLSLTEGVGEYKIKLRCVQVGKEKEIFSSEVPLKFKNPQQIIDINFQLTKIQFPDYGDYRFETLCDNQPLTARKFKISSTP